MGDILKWLLRIQLLILKNIPAVGDLFSIVHGKFAMADQRISQTFG